MGSGSDRKRVRGGDGRGRLVRSASCMFHRMAAATAHDAELEFHPLVSGGHAGVSIWLPEFELLGEGDDLAAARADLLAEVREYVEAHEADTDLAAAPNRREHAPFVEHARRADADGRLEGVVFPVAPALS